MRKQDPDAVFDRCYIQHIGGGGEHINTQNYIRYKDHIYFLAYKARLGKAGEILPGMHTPIAKEQYGYSWVAFGSIHLQTHKVEILKDYKSAYWKVTNGLTPTGVLGKPEPVISISHNKIWYITYERDDEEQFGADHGNLALKCLDIHTKEESIVRVLPGVKDAGMPIVMGNTFAYVSGGKLLFENPKAQKTGKKTCYRILGYNESKIIYSGESNGEVRYNPAKVSLLDVETGDSSSVKQYFAETIGYKDKIEKLHYIDCKKRQFYIEARDNKNNFYIAIVSENGKVEYRGESNGRYRFVSNFDGRFENIAFNGTIYAMGDFKGGASKFSMGEIKKKFPDDSRGYFVAVRKDGTWKGWKCPAAQTGTASDCDSYVMVPVAEDCAMVQMEKNVIYLHQNENFYKIFEYER